PLAISFGLLPVALYLTYLPASALAFSAGIQIALSSAIIGTVFLLAEMLYQRRNAISAITHDQSNTIIIGLAVGLIPAAAWIFSRVFDVVLPVSLEGLMPFFVPVAA